MDLREVLDGYNNRIKSISSYYFIMNSFIGKVKPIDIRDDEFCNTVFSLLCYIMEKSLAGKNCIKEDLEIFMKEFIEITKEDRFSVDDINALVNKILLNLTNKGKVYSFEYYNVEKDKKENFEIKLISTDVVNIDGEDCINYSLTEDGYKLILSTKEYDDLSQLQISQMILRLKLEKGDLNGVKDALKDIRSNIEIQYRKIDKFLSGARKSVENIQTDKYNEIVIDTFNVIIEERDKYKEREVEIERQISISRTLLEEQKENMTVDLGIKEENLQKLNAISKEYRIIQNSISRLIHQIQNLKKEYQEILMNSLKVFAYKGFNFEKEILERIEKDINLIPDLENVYRPLFILDKASIYSPRVAYEEQEITEERETSEGYIVFDEEISEDTEEKEIVRKTEDFYCLFMTEIFEYATNISKQFTLKDFLNHYLSSNQELYLKLTNDTTLFRDVLMFFNFDQSRVFDMNVIKKELLISNFFASVLFEMNRTVGLVMDEKECLIDRIDSFRVLYPEDRDDKVTVKTEIDLKTLTANEMECPNLIFDFELKFK